MIPSTATSSCQKFCLDKILQFQLIFLVKLDVTCFSCWKFWNRTNASLSWQLAIAALSHEKCSFHVLSAFLKLNLFFLEMHKLKFNFIFVVRTHSYIQKGIVVCCVLEETWILVFAIIISIWAWRYFMLCIWL